MSCVLGSGAVLQRLGDGMGQYIIHKESAVLKMVNTRALGTEQ